MDVRPFTFSYAELKTATNDFDSANKLGEGGFGPVFKVLCRYNRTQHYLQYKQCSLLMLWTSLVASIFFLVF